jgi:hypothetical protein
VPAHVWDPGGTELDTTFVDGEVRVARVRGGGGEARSVVVRRGGGVLPGAEGNQTLCCRC